MRIYISGPITNVPDYKEKFSKAEQKLKEMHPEADIINPTVLSDLPLTYDEYMDLDLRLLDMCGAVYMLHGWEKSKGACIEYGYALAKDLIILNEREQ